MHDAWTVGGVVFLALIFNFLNGMHDAANSIATAVSTRVLSPKFAVAWAAFFNFIAYLVFPLAVAKMIGKGIVAPAAITMPIVTAGLLGVIVWNLLTWWAGIPSSSSHALVGGFAGAAFVAHGLEALRLGPLLKIASFIVVAPVMGMVVGYLTMVGIFWLVRRWAPSRVGRVFKRVQLFSAAAYSLGHGGNDAQNAMGIIFAVLIAASPAAQQAWGFHATMAEPPVWVVYASHAAIGLGTLLGGWRIVKTMGQKICRLQPVHGSAAETAGAMMLYGATWMGIPVSTTHTITGAIVGVGSTRGRRAVRWGIATRIMWAWVITIPASATVAALCWWGFTALGWR